MRAVRVTAFVILLVLVTAACGARLSPADRRAAADAVLATGNGSGGTGGTSTGGPDGTGVTSGSGPNAGVAGTGGTGAGSTGARGTGTGTTGTGTTRNGGGSGPGGTAHAGTCPTGGNDVGLTGNSVSLGTVASTTGPVNGLFEGAIQGAQAWRAFENAQGGICGHTVTIRALDDGTSCNGNQNDTQQLSEGAFALVGSFSLYDGCGAKYLNAHTAVPDLHVQLDPAAGGLPSHFDMEPGPLGYATGMFAYYRQKLGDKVKHVGTLFPNIPSAIDKQKAFVHSAESQGWTFVYSRAGDATESDWTNDFVKMCHQRGVQIFFTPAENATNAAKMVNDEAQAGCSGLVNIIPIAYDQAFPAAVGNNKTIEGLLGWNEYSLFFNQDEAQRIPELAQLQSWFARTNGGKPLNLYALFAWAEGRLFEKAFQSAGPTINRGTLVAALKKIHTFDANGIMAPVDPGSHSTGVRCYILWEFHNGAFQRVDDPATGYRCDGQWLPLNG